MDPVKSRSGQIVHVRLDCDLDVPLMRDAYGDMYDPKALAKSADVAGAIG